ncbi:MAG TPA: hypothetical protein VGB45_09850 [Abditibacterium sp.]|jgi:hypothetical protein
MKKGSKLSLQKRGIIVAGRAQNANGAQIHADKRKPPRAAQKQQLKRQLQLETARNRGPFPFLRESFSLLPKSFFPRHGKAHG